MNETAPRPVVGNTASAAAPTTSTPAPHASGERARLAAWIDSPWFWMAAFAYVGLVWLAAFGPKYGRRQEILERRFEARQEIARRGASGAPEDQSLAAAGGILEGPNIDIRAQEGGDVRAQEGRDVRAQEGPDIGTHAEDPLGAQEPPPHKLLVSLDPLMFMLAMALEFALANLLRPYFAGHSPPEPAPVSAEKPP